MSGATTINMRGNTVKLNPSEQIISKVRLTTLFVVFRRGSSLSDTIGIFSPNVERETDFFMNRLKSGMI